MTRIQQKDNIEIKNSNSIVSFETEGTEQWEVWTRFLAINKKPAYEIGNICGTCKFYFERLEGANQSIHPNELISKLNEGLKSIDKSTIDIISKIIPNGKYKVIFIKVYPKIIELGSSKDYFVTDSIELWGVDGFWGLPHNPKIPYYRGTDQKMQSNGKLFEFIIPMYPQNWLNYKRVSEYKSLLNKRILPTAISLSILDIKAPVQFDENDEKEIDEHWCLSHYILDGHHKIFAAAASNKAINLISFLAINEGISNEREIDELLGML